jgi:heme-degrading monooxygenase HmoA
MAKRADEYAKAKADILKEVAMFARVSTMVGDPARADDGVRMLEMETLPELEHIEGFQRIFAVMDRGTGKSLVITLWESEEAR